MSHTVHPNSHAHGSQQIIAHTTTAQLSFHVENFVAISVIVCCGLLRASYRHYIRRGYCPDTRSLYWRHYERDGVSNHRRLQCLLTRLCQAQIKENIKAPRDWPLWGEFTGDRRFPSQRASNAENVSTWWRHHVKHTIAPCQVKQPCWIRVNESYESISAPLELLRSVRVSLALIWTSCWTISPVASDLSRHIGHVNSLQNQVRLVLSYALHLMYWPCVLVNMKLVWWVTLCPVYVGLHLHVGALYGDMTCYCGSQQVFNQF